MYVKVLFDKQAQRGLESGKGFSCLIDGKILFDTGEGPTSLIGNMKKLMVNAESLEGVVISHDHWDHTGGLWELLKRKKGLKVYALSSFSDTFKKCVEELGGELIFADTAVEISKNILVTGEIKGSYKGEDMTEQAMVVKGDKGVSVITGCAHAGIIPVLKHIRENLGIKNIYMVFGGFHLEGLKRDDIGNIVSDLKSMGVEKAGPTHCSGEMARRVFSGKYHDNFIAVQAGYIIHL